MASLISQRTGNNQEFKIKTSSPKELSEGSCVPSYREMGTVLTGR